MPKSIYQYFIIPYLKFEWKQDKEGVYENVNLDNKSDRELIAYALVNIMCEHHIVSYTDLEGARKDPAMEEFIKNCGCKPNKEDIPVKRGL